VTDSERGFIAAECRCGYHYWGPEDSKGRHCLFCKAEKPAVAQPSLLLRLARGIFNAHYSSNTGKG